MDKPRFTIKQLLFVVGGFCVCGAAMTFGVSMLMRDGLALLPIILLLFVGPTCALVAFLVMGTEVSRKRWVTIKTLLVAVGLLWLVAYLDSFLHFGP